MLPAYLILPTAKSGHCVYIRDAILDAILPLVESRSTLAILSIHIAFLNINLAANIHNKQGAEPVVITAFGFSFIMIYRHLKKFGIIHQGFFLVKSLI